MFPGLLMAVLRCQLLFASEIPPTPCDMTTLGRLFKITVVVLASALEKL
jgi:hypothetical protein